MPAKVESYRQWHEQSVALSGISFQRPTVVLKTGALTAEIHFNLDPLQKIWTDFEQIAHSTFYQTYLWCSAWFATIGQASDTRPVVVILRDSNCQIQAILPLQIRRAGRLLILEWLATPSNNYGYALYHPDFIQSGEEWFRNYWLPVVNGIGFIDAVVLRDNPSSVFGVVNPMTRMFT